MCDGAVIINHCLCLFIRRLETSCPLQTLVHVHTHEQWHAPAAFWRFRITAFNLHSNSPPAELMGERKTTEDETKNRSVRGKKRRNARRESTIKKS